MHGVGRRGVAAVASISLIALLVISCQAKPRADIGDDIGSAVGVGLSVVMSAAELFSKGAAIRGSSDTNIDVLGQQLNDKHSAEAGFGDAIQSGRRRRQVDETMVDGGEEGDDDSAGEGGKGGKGGSGGGRGGQGGQGGRGGGGGRRGGGGRGGENNDEEGGQGGGGGRGGGGGGGRGGQGGQGGRGGAGGRRGGGGRGGENNDEEGGQGGGGGRGGRGGGGGRRGGGGRGGGDGGGKDDGESEISNDVEQVERRKRAAEPCNGREPNEAQTVERMRRSAGKYATTPTVNEPNVMAAPTTQRSFVAKRSIVDDVDQVDDMPIERNKRAAEPCNGRKPNATQAGIVGDHRMRRNVDQGPTTPMTVAAEEQRSARVVRQVDENGNGGGSIADGLSKAVQRFVDAAHRLAARVRDLFDGADGNDDGGVRRSKDVEEFDV